MVGSFSSVEKLSPGKLHKCSVTEAYLVKYMIIFSASVVTYPQLKTMLSNRDIQLFDVREPDEYQEGRIPDAVNIPRKFFPSCSTALAFFVKLPSFFCVGEIQWALWTSL